MILLVGALLVIVLPGRLRATIAILSPALALYYIYGLPDGTRVSLSFIGQDLTVLRADGLSLVFGKIFSLVGVIAGVYAWHINDRKQQVFALLYNAGALGVTFAGDYFTLYAFWELLAISSVILIWSRKREDSQRAGNRYILVHLVGGAFLLAGILMYRENTGTLAFERFLPGEGGMAAWLILIGFCLNAAVPPLGAWLPDSYPRATVTGAIYCSALTTKTAVYTLLRGYPGWEILTIAGVVMALYGVVYAVLANDIRELLAYHIISQVGYMVAGVGIGTAMAVNGATAHAVSHILYKALLFMGAGVVIQTTGREKLTELGGFWRRQKLVFGLYMIGAFSISGFPLWNGFISKSMVVAAAGYEHLDWAYLLLMLASVGTFLHTGLKLPYGTWMGEDKGIEPTPAPKNMVVAMAIAAFFCTFMGVVPGFLYQYLPYAVDWNPWTFPARDGDGADPVVHVLLVLGVHSDVARTAHGVDGYRRSVPQDRAVLPPGVRGCGGCGVRRNGSRSRQGGACGDAVAAGSNEGLARGAATGAYRYRRISIRTVRGHPCCGRWDCCWRCSCWCGWWRR